MRRAARTRFPARDISLSMPATLERAASEAAFFAAPRGRYIVAERLAYWCVSETLWGATASGAVDAAMIRRLMSWIEEEYRHDYPAYRCLADASSVTALEPAAFEAFVAFQQGHRGRQKARVVEAAIVRPAEGLRAATVGGMVAVIEPGAPWQVVASIDDGLRALGIAPDPDLASAIRAVRDDCAGAAGELDALRRVLDEHARGLSVDDAARALALSARTLQRKLQDAGSTFEAELRKARVRRAQALLLDTDQKLGAIALEAGFATQAHFNRVFRDETGATPGAFRKRQRGG